MSLVDLIAVTVLALFLWRGYTAGFWAYMARFGSLVVGLILALYAYAPLSTVLASQFALSSRIASVAAFVVSLLVFQAAIDLGLAYVFRKYAGIFAENRATRLLALLPATADALLVLLLLVVASSTLPLSTNVTTQVSESHAGKLAAEALPQVRTVLDRATGGRLSAALGALTTYPGQSGEARTLPFRPSSTAIDEAAEAQMLVLVNEERAKVGAPPLMVDQALVRSARAHSTDMWERQYFAHENPDGESPFDRMQEAGAKFLLAGENLALAPTVRLAHTGLMNSPGHRRNILDPTFRRVGIGIIDGGIYGKMVTQNFAN